MPILKSKPLRRLSERFVITLAPLYLLSPFGATFNAVVIPDTHALTYGLMLAALFAWLVLRLRDRWRWHRTALDPIMLLWLLAIGASMLANPEVLRRGLIALWFVATYIGAWYFLQDWIANRPSCKELIVDGLLGAGLMVIIFSALEILHTGRLLQPVSIMGNSNALGSVLVVIIPFALRKVWRARAGAHRAVWRIYSAIAIANLILTLSRGAWIGLFAACAMLLLLLLAHFGLLSPTRFLVWWQKRKELTRRLALLSSIAVMLCVLCAAALVVHSFTLKERSADLRTEIWQSAIIQFSDAPFTGHGLFAFGRNNGRHLSIPPAQSYAHAHNLPLNVAAEMGILGLSALGATVLLTVQRLRRIWHVKTGEDRLDWIFFVAPVIGLAVHHFFDVTAMMPAVALLGILTLALAVDTSYDHRIASARSGNLCALGLALLWICLLVVGFRNMQFKSRYIAALRLPAASNEHPILGEPALRYRQALDSLEQLIASDPTMPVYHLQSAILWGLLAAGGEGEAIDAGIEAFERFLDLEPYHAVSWANLAVLQWQADDRSAAIRSMEQARRLAPRLPLLAIKLYQYRNDDGIAPILLPHSRYNQDFTRYQFLAESLPITFLPQIAWSFQRP
ncbi:MAG: O-antigen ligase family protein [Chloroflexota bacterium]|nr:O-antigen ligase family protein [Chloroflexota bacterium]